MRLIDKLKFKLLQILLDDICKRSECDNCVNDEKSNVCNNNCCESRIFVQACRAWTIPIK